MKLTQCKKASLYDLNNRYLCDADVSDIAEDSVSLHFSSPASDLLFSEVHVTFYDNVQGLVTYYCALSGYQEFLTAPRTMGSSVICRLNQEISVIQRRNDMKVPVQLKTTLTVINSEDILTDVAATITDISAGGLFFTSRYSFYVGQTFSFFFDKNPPAFQLEAEILRVNKQEPDTDSSSSADSRRPRKVLYGYGCRFIHLSPYKESIIRNFVYKRDLTLHHRKPADPL